MFSGLKYIFGYTDETAPATVSDVTGTTGETGQNNDVTPSTETTAPSTKLEQTLNAATTKFTEQLLPQQASIEQLQSSSHQLLPSIVEQHEEEELKRKSLDDDDLAAEVDADDDGFNVESWELLDLVDKAEGSATGLTASVQRDESSKQKASKSTGGGILKTTNDTGNGSSRQKPKVSFEAPDLVRIEHEIEQTEIATVANEALPTALEAAHVFEVGASEVVGKVKPRRQLPVLNYAKAVSTKVAAEASASAAKKVAEPQPCSSKSLDKEANSPVKRVRPARVSTSSWSSHDDDENEIEQVQGDDWEKSGGEDAVVERGAQLAEADDNESVISSGFSDCDYGFGGINDYVMRPKKANAKRGRTLSSSFGSTGAKAGGKCEKKLAQAKAKLASAVDARNQTAAGSSTSGAKDIKSEAPAAKSSKPKKKRMIMSASKPCNLSDFLKSRPDGDETDQSERKKTEGPGCRQAASGGGSTESSDVADMDESWFVTPPSCFTGAVVAKRAGAGKVDLPRAREADRENALIEHPKVYIANAASKSSAEAQRDTAKQKGKWKSKAKSSKVPSASQAKSLSAFEDDFWNSEREDDCEDDIKFDDDDQFMSLGKVVGVTSAGELAEPVASVASPSRLEALVVSAGPKKGAAKKSKYAKAKVSVTKPARKPADEEAWRNKFIVDDWDLNDNEDAESDFDNIFVPSKKRKPFSGEQKYAKRNKKGKKAPRSHSSYVNLPEMASFEDDHSGSVELLSVKSLAPQEFDDVTDENVEPPRASADSELAEQQVLEEPAKPAASQAPSKSPVGDNRRPPIQVRPIEPERVPSWQLKRQRSKRRPLGAVAPKQPLTQQTSSSGSPKAMKSKDSSSSSSSPSSSVSSSSRSTPTLIDRIGCSIVANLTNLTNGLVSSGAVNCCPAVVNGRASLMESQERAVASKSSFTANNSAAAHAYRKQLSRGSIRRQNICAKQGNSLRRADRRLKLFATPNGCSVNRKVHTSIH